MIENDARSQGLALDREPPRNIEVSFWNRLVTVISKMEPFFAFLAPPDAGKSEDVFQFSTSLMGRLGLSISAVHLNEGIKPSQCGPYAILVSSVF
jgi:hypothetical protein